MLQVSRWDGLKDPVGLMEGFATRVAAEVPEVYLMLASPAEARVADDPESQAVLEETVARRAALPPEIRRRVRPASPPGGGQRHWRHPGHGVEDPHPEPALAAG